MAIDQDASANQDDHAALGQRQRLMLLAVEIDRVDTAIRMARRDLSNQNSRLDNLSERINDLIDQIGEEELAAVEAAQRGDYARAHAASESAGQLRLEVEETMADRDHLQTMIAQLSGQLAQLQDGCDRIRGALHSFHESGLVDADFPTLGSA